MRRLLLVEDEHVNRELFRRRLERKGYAVIAAEDGAGAVALTKSEKPDLVLMDLGLPDIDGWEATRRIKADPATTAIPVLVLSAHATTEAREQAFAAGCVEFETKPVNWEVLFKKIEDAIQKALERGRAAALPDPGLTGVVAAPPPRRASAPEPGPPKQILVVEDNDANRAMLCRRLNKHGYATTEAADGQEALDAVRSRRFDLVLCDIMMPGVDGFEVLRQMRTDPDLQTVPVIMVSALDEMAGVVRCIEMGAEDYLHKPYDPVLLHARVAACLDKRRLRDQEAAYRRAVKDLTEAAARVERGEFDPALLEPIAARDDELGALARVFDRMAREVLAHTHQTRGEIPRLAAEAKSGAETIVLPPVPKSE
jgi:two-component system, cell cycle response regulator